MSVLDMSFTSMVLPKLLDIFLTGNNVISYHGCIAQVFFFVVLMVSEYFILASMAYDRYVAICHPLRYSYFMSLQINSKEGRQKTFSTCSSHLTVILLFYGTVLGMYMRPKSSYSMDQDKAHCGLMGPMDRKTILPSLAGSLSTEASARRSNSTNFEVRHRESGYPAGGMTAPTQPEKLEIVIHFLKS
ncbi:unnamed protein product [Ranitomeya imitator]|uniref:G-protein coupled receptors family 1 profile domain-containing protein n=1 Tax=Ranitomeya imitator TaxID=111125 RepID=A0ABN9L7I1_9NEOB|nr:unnamed protein product [Ranitomeya imitator]